MSAIETRVIDRHEAALGARGDEEGMTMAKMLIVQNCSLCGYCRHGGSRHYCQASAYAVVRPCPALGVRDDCPLPDWPDAPRWVAVSERLPTGHIPRLHPF